ncbi:MAG: hypothetical protein A4E49_00193 [Methanosaeta sp. PtaU1.Bin112]|nr:MAG: hypothetical protein A4E49_00193 [Methanosaeta sp. PtaU1.Bin112]
MLIINSLDSRTWISSSISAFSFSISSSFMHQLPNQCIQVHFPSFQVNFRRLILFQDAMHIHLLFQDISIYNDTLRDLHTNYVMAICRPNSNCFRSFSVRYVPISSERFSTALLLLVISYSNDTYIKIKIQTRIKMYKSCYPTTTCPSLGVHKSFRAQ